MDMVIASESCHDGHQSMGVFRRYRLRSAELKRDEPGVRQTVWINRLAAAGHAESLLWI
jgi:hypothetical protein